MAALNFRTRPDGDDGDGNGEDEVDGNDDDDDDDDEDILTRRRVETVGRRKLELH